MIILVGSIGGEDHGHARVILVVTVSLMASTVAAKLLAHLPAHPLRGTIG